MALALVESDYGPAVARRVARWMVVFLQRPGGQAQFSVWAQSELPVTRGLREILDSIVADPGADHSIAAMAVRAAVSERHLVRMFGDQVGMTPARFVEQARLEAAKVLLATGDHSQEAVARRAGFGGADTMRRTFRRNLGISPGTYRSRFRTTGIEQGGLNRRPLPSGVLPLSARPTPLSRRPLRTRLDAERRATTVRRLAHQLGQPGVTVGRHAFGRSADRHHANRAAIDLEHRRRDRHARRVHLTAGGVPAGAVGLKERAERRVGRFAKQFGLPVATQERQQDAAGGAVARGGRRRRRSAPCAAAADSPRPVTRPGSTRPAR